ncbi:MAG: methionine adenosyltransferase [Alphaproteobacteria bacterium]|jgi:S-adenosylmethionine synthetase|nr:methionine adenosyltransferase [Alphaproteobacteria bacterium]
MERYIFTSESVSEGHPDKLCDQLSDALLDAYLTRDPYARVAIESVATKGRVILVGEVSCLELVDIGARERLVRDLIRRVGYEQQDFDWRTLEVQDYLQGQSADIAQGVVKDDGTLGAGDQGIMFGFACGETPSYMPAPLHYAHRVLESIKQGRARGELLGLGPDAKAQLSVKYEGGKARGLSCLVVSTQHDAGLSCQDVKRLIKPYVEAALPRGWMCDDEHFYVNPTGQFVIGGPAGDSGLTGRKIIVDTYGGRAPHGGGAFSGKDPTKVDRSAAYMARYLAKNIVAAGLADCCTIQLSYVIGMCAPVSVYVDLHGTSDIQEEVLSRFIQEKVDLTPAGIINRLALRRPIYERTAAYGHFGRTPQNDGSFSWEKLDLVETLLQEFPSKSGYLAGAS